MLKTISIFIYIYFYASYKYKSQAVTAHAGVKQNSHQTTVCSGYTALYIGSMSTYRDKYLSYKKYEKMKVLSFPGNETWGVRGREDQEML